MTQYMLLFSLGPVQSFIAQARKARDLWLGSFLLSLLMEAAMKDIASSALIFPAHAHRDTIDKNIPDLPNKYVAHFTSLQEAQSTAQYSTQQIRACWLRICEDVWQNVVVRSGQQNITTTRAIWERQIHPETFFEIFWVIAQRDDGQDYHAWLQQAQEALAARKRSRSITWQHYSVKEQGNEPGEKSTISGIREALHGPDSTHEAVLTFWKNLAVAFPLDLNQNGEERLDAVDTVKRFALHSRVLSAKNIDATFPSTSSIAVASFVKQLMIRPIDTITLLDWLKATRHPLDRMAVQTIPYLKQLTGEYTDKQTLLRRDGDCYFPETFTPRHLSKDYALTPESEAVYRARTGQKALSRLLQATDHFEIRRPTPYYAMLQMDGDKMGALLGGVENEEEHSAISKALSTFSRVHAPAIAHTRYPARLIYAGGDDALALAPLTHEYTPEELTTLQQNRQAPIKTILTLADHLQQAYRAEIRIAVHDEVRKHNATASTGIAIAHHYTALSYVRLMAKTAEELAKKHYGRNALVVMILRRSGEQTRVGCHWEYIHEQRGKKTLLQPIPLFMDFYELFAQDSLAPRCIYLLLEEAPTLVALEQAAQQSEIIRILRRHRTQEEQLPDATLSSLARQLSELAIAMDLDKRQPTQQPLATELHASTRRYGLVEVLGWLLVMIFLARKEKE